MSEAPQLLVASLEGDAGALLLIEGIGAETRVRARLEMPGAPHAIAMHPLLPIAYVACWGDNSAHIVSVQLAAQRRGESGAGEPLLTVRSVVPAGGTLPCSLAVAPDGSALAVALYEGGVAVNSLSDGVPDALAPVVTALSGSGPRADRQESSHPHAVLFDGATRLIVADLGADRVRVFELDPNTSQLTGVRDADGEAEPGSGPRHIALLTDGRAVVADELSSTVSVYEPEVERYAFRSRVPSSSGGPEINYPSDLAVTADQQFVFVANRGHGTIAAFRVDATGLKLHSEQPSGSWPLNLACIGDQLWCASRDDNAVLSWRIDEGTLVEPSALEVNSPSWVEPVPRHWG